MQSESREFFIAENPRASAKTCAEEGRVRSHRLVWAWEMKDLINCTEVFEGQILTDLFHQFFAVFRFRYVGFGTDLQKPQADWNLLCHLSLRSSNFRRGTKTRSFFLPFLSSAAISVSKLPESRKMASNDRNHMGTKMSHIVRLRRDINASNAYLDTDRWRNCTLEELEGFRMAGSHK